MAVANLFTLSCTVLVRQRASVPLDREQEHRVQQFATTINQR